jgi:hypothetical protein
MKYRSKLDVLHGIKTQAYFAITCNKNVMLNCKLFCCEQEGMGH